MTHHSSSRTYHIYRIVDVLQTTVFPLAYDIQHRYLLHIYIQYYTICKLKFWQETFLAPLNITFIQAIHINIMMQNHCTPYLPHIVILDNFSINVKGHYGWFRFMSYLSMYYIQYTSYIPFHFTPHTLHTSHIQMDPHFYYNHRHVICLLNQCRQYRYRFTQIMIRLGIDIFNYLLWLQQVPAYLAYS